MRPSFFLYLGIEQRTFWLWANFADHCLCVFFIFFLRILYIQHKIHLSLRDAYICRAGALPHPLDYNSSLLQLVLLSLRLRPHHYTPPSSRRPSEECERRAWEDCLQASSRASGRGVEMNREEPQ